MTKITHHLTEPLLMAYAAGTLPEAFNLVLATHLSMCDECRARAESFDAIGGAVLEQSDTVALDPCAFEATMALIAAPHQEQIRVSGASHGASEQIGSEDSVFPAPLQDYVGGDLDAVKWRSVGGGVRQAILPATKEATVRLLYIPAGSAVPDHGHKGTELTLVLQGAFRDSGERFARGDVEVATQDLTHTPIAEDGMDCVCLAATDAPLRFKGILPRLAQPFLRI